MGKSKKIENFSVEKSLVYNFIFQIKYFRKISCLSVFNILYKNMFQKKCFLTNTKCCFFTKNIIIKSMLINIIQ